MKEWREVFGTEAEQPEEFDTTASPTTVYQRRNIKKATKEDADGKKITGWQREEREMSREEYDRLTLMQEVVASNTTGIVESVTQFDDNAERRDVSVLWILHGCVRSEVVVCSI